MDINLSQASLGLLHVTGSDLGVHHLVSPLCLALCCSLTVFSFCSGASLMHQGKGAVREGWKSSFCPS